MLYLESQKITAIKMLKIQLEQLIFSPGYRRCLKILKYGRFARRYAIGFPGHLIKAIGFYRYSTR